MTREEARKILRGKTLQELIDLWNEDCRSHGLFMSTAHKMSDNSWWNELFRKTSSAWMLINDLLGSGEQFNVSDKWFFWDEDTEQAFKARGLCFYAYRWNAFKSGR